jgi:hypothetical protein
MRRSSRVLLALSTAVVSLMSCDNSTPLEPSAVSDARSATRGGGGPELAAPSNPTATRSGPSRIDVRWQDNSGNETGFEVHRSTTGAAGPYALLAASGASTVTYPDVSADSEKDHCYRVRAVRGTGGKTSYSAFSTEACVPASPASLYEVRARPLGSTMIHIATTWTGSTAAPARRVYRSADGGVTWELIATGLYAPWLLDERPSEQEACYRVVAFNEGGDAAASNTACTTPPAGPTSLAGTMTGPTTLELTWSDNSSVEDGYQVWMLTYAYNCESSGYSEGEILIADLPAGSTVYAAIAQTLIPCEYGALYYVLATKDGGRSDASEAISAGP